MGFTDIFDELEPAERVALLNKAVPKDFEDGAVIIDEHRANNAIFIVMDGEVRVEKDVGGKAPLVLAELGIGAIIGEMSFLTRKRPSARIIAQGGVELLCVTHSNITELVRNDPGLASRFYHSVAVTLAHRLEATNSKLARASKAQVEPSERHD